MTSGSTEEEYSLTWKGHIQHVRDSFTRLLKNNHFCDVTLYAEGQKIGAHKVFLTACSEYFSQLFEDFKDDHPIIVLKGVQFDILQQILRFIYKGEVSIEMGKLNAFLETAEFLKIVGLMKGKIHRDTAMKKSPVLSCDNDTSIDRVECLSINSSIEESIVSQVSSESQEPTQVVASQTHLDINDETSLTERLLQTKGYKFFKGQAVLEKVLTDNSLEPHNVQKTNIFHLRESTKRGESWTSDYEIHPSEHTQSSMKKDNVSRRNTDEASCSQSYDFMKKKKVKLERTNSNLEQIDEDDRHL